jgi:hypothetical protein
MHAAGESGLDWRQTVTHRELALGKPEVGGSTPEEAGLRGEVNLALTAESTTGGPSSRARDEAPDSVRNDNQADGNGQKTTPVQAQEA